MPDSGEAIAIRLVEAIEEVGAAAWDACAGADNPFLTYAFLHALEASGSATTATGWRPQHLVAEDSRGRVIGVVPMYLKSHSYGEYVFDHGWADAYRRAGGRYYPKLQVAVPFTPVTGARVLIVDRPDRAAIRAALIEALETVAERRRVSSLHVTFCMGEEAEAFAGAGFLIRSGFQYHWENRGYGSFDDFLAALSHGKRKSIRKERRDVAAQGVEVIALNGDDLRPEHWDKFFEFYYATSDRKWGAPYLTRDFFARLHDTMRDKVVLMMARKGGRWVAGALNLMGRDTLYGRNWGSYGDFRFLHFEACYYRAIDFAIERGLARVEAGAQGEHKVQRGYLPQPTWSAHWIADPGFREAVDRFLQQETALIRHEMAALHEHSPFKQANGAA
ncbi:MAG TPA: GNAT family N-acetyltransferase [Alphaproteobacteria bacterium]|nr:GNAT family N-acetyltransferase [Alphaproteobacteria bacterium]